MHVGVDATCWQNKRGYGRHIRALLDALVPLDTSNRYTFFMDSDEQLECVPAGAVVRQLGNARQTALAASADGHRSLADMWRTSRMLSQRGLDVLLFPTIYSFVPTVTPAKKIVILHDVIAERYPQLTLPHPLARFFWRAKVAAGRAQADALVTVSEYSRRNIVAHFGVDPDRVFVVGEASDPQFRPLQNPCLSPALAAAGIPPGRRLVVYVGGFGPHKNLEALVKSFASIAANPAFSDAVLVMVGEYRKEVFHSHFQCIAKLAQAAGLGNRIVFTGYLSDQDLIVLLNLAAVLVLPSLMEGFGLPAVEAAACGCPVIATSESPLPELLKGGGIFIDPRTESLTPALETVLGSEALRRKMSLAALAAARELSWSVAARQMMDVIRKVTRT